MKAMVFAAGFGNRLRPLTDKLPKALVSVAGRPMIEYSLLLLRHYGITEVVINLHHLGEKIVEHLRDGERLGLKIAYSPEESLLDTGGGLLRARSKFRDETFLAINSDILMDLRLDDLSAFHSGKGAAATLVLRPDGLADRYGAIETSADFRIRRFLGHRAPQGGGALDKFMFTGAQVLEPRVFDYMAEAGPSPAPFSITRATYPAMLTRGEPLYGFRFDGYWQDLGTIERIREAEAKLLSGEVKLHYLRE